MRRPILALAALLAATPALSAPRSRPPADLTGLWSNGSWTTFDRPEDVKALVLTPEEARAREALLAKTGGLAANPQDKVGQAESEFLEAGAGLMRVRGQPRTSWLLTSDGKVPYRPEVRARLRKLNGFDNPEERPGQERCLSANGSGAPLVAEEDANVMQIVQAGDTVAIASEKSHEVRTVRIGDRHPHQPASWAGDSVGRWEGATLVVETRNFRGAVVDRDEFRHSGDAVITERFTRTAPDEIAYAWTVVDPAFFLQPFGGEGVFRAVKGPMYEYACHEGNYSIRTILQAARLGKQEAPRPAPTPSPPPVPAKAGAQADPVGTSASGSSPTKPGSRPSPG